MAALGEEFRRAREARGLTISDVAERLHIRSVYLAAIEDEDWSTIGAAVYIRGFLRTYARFLGLDPESAIARLSEAGPSPATATAAEERRERRRGPSVAAIVMLAVAVALVGFVAYQYFLYRSEGPAPPLSATATAVPSVEAPSAALPAGPAAEATPVAVPAPLPSSPRLAIRVTETSWLRVVVDGKLALEGTFPPGTARSFAGKAATVRVGNAGGVAIAIGGRSVGKLGADGDVVERSFVIGE
jgi:cytoskeletal protein RodZ